MAASVTHLSRHSATRLSRPDSGFLFRFSFFSSSSIPKRVEHRPQIAEIQAQAGMEDDSEGWEIQEYSPSGEEDGKVVMKRIIRRGLRFGKTMIVTGVVISSAPFVLPPLMVVSAFGLACSVPFGVFVASYACADKLMSKLLPMPKPPPPLPLMLEYKGYDFSCVDLDSEEDIFESDNNDGKEEEEDQLVRETEAVLDSEIPLQMSEDVYTEGGVDLEEEEGRLLEDTKATIEMRISLQVGEETEIVREDKYYEGKAHVEEQKGEEGYQEDDESVAQQEELSTPVGRTEISGSEIHPMVEVLRQERPIDNVNIDNPNLPQKTHEDLMCRVFEVERPYGSTIGPIELTATAKERGDADQGEQLTTKDLERHSKHKGLTSGTNEDIGSQFTPKCRAIKIDDVCNTGVEGSTEMSGVIETAIHTPSEQLTETPEHELVDTKDNTSKQSVNVAPTNVELVGETPCMQRENLDDQDAAADAAGTTKRKKKTKKKKPKSGEGTVLNIQYKEQEVAVSPATDARNAANWSRLNFAGDKKGGEETQSNLEAAGIVHPNESGTTSGPPPSGGSLTATPKKALLGEEKIWENIEALRTIVGYRVARHQTCMEELKALYIFTGVEPPMSFKSSPGVTDSLDLDEVNDKLRFLMATVGVK